MGSIYKRAGVYYVNVMANGKRVRRRIGRSKRTAELVLKDLEVKITRQEFDLDVPDGTLEQAFSHYLDYSDTNHAPRTTLRYSQVIANFKFFLLLRHPNIERVSQLDLVTIEQYKKFRKDTDPRTLVLPDDFPIKIRPNAMAGSPKTINYELKTLKSIFTFARKRGLCRQNPLEDVTYFRIQEEAEPRFLTREECERLLGAADRKLHPIFYTFLNTGLRLGELINLQWRDVDLKRTILHVRKKGDWQPKAGERQVPLNEGMVKLLKGHKPKGAKDQQYVFPSVDGGKLKTKLRKALIKTAVAAGLEDVTKIHTRRHTFASHLVMSGVDLPSVKELLGHADIQTTMIYAHLAPDHLAGAVNKLSF